MPRKKTAAPPLEDAPTVERPDSRAPRRGEGERRGGETAPNRTAARPSAVVDTRVVYCGDNLEQLRKLPDACVDLTYGEHPPGRPFCQPAPLRPSL